MDDMEHKDNMEDKEDTYWPRMWLWMYLLTMVPLPHLPPPSADLDSKNLDWEVF